jgi:hypothetical protein
MRRVIPEQYVNVLWLIILGTLWGSSYLFIKITVAEVPALVLVSGRLVVASTVMWIALRVLGIPVPRSWQTWRSFVLLGLFGAAVPYTLITWGEQYIPSGLASLLQATTPIFAVLLARFWTSDERITAGKAVGVILGFVGVVFLMVPDLRSGRVAGAVGHSRLLVLLRVDRDLCPASSPGTASPGLGNGAVEHGRRVYPGGRAADREFVRSVAFFPGVGELGRADLSGNDPGVRHLFHTDPARWGNLCHHGDLCHPRERVDPGRVGAWGAPEPRRSGQPGADPVRGPVGEGASRANPLTVKRRRLLSRIRMDPSKGTCATMGQAV